MTGGRVSVLTVPVFTVPVFTGGRNGPRIPTGTPAGTGTPRRARPRCPAIPPPRRSGSRRTPRAAACPAGGRGLERRGPLRQVGAERRLDGEIGRQLPQLGPGPAGVGGRGALVELIQR